ncbi:MAG: hypothetical protein U0736_04565 [Gemmataceae bacterium]
MTTAVGGTTRSPIAPATAITTSTTPTRNPGGGGCSIYANQQGHYYYLPPNLQHNNLNTLLTSNVFNDVKGGNWPPLAGGDPGGPGDIRMEPPPDDNPPGQEFPNP